MVWSCRGELPAAVAHFRRAVARATLRNPNPLDGAPFYNLGLALRLTQLAGSRAAESEDLDEEAYAAFYKATWNWEWRSAAYYALAQADARRQVRHDSMLWCIRESTGVMQCPTNDYEILIQLSAVAVYVAPDVALYVPPTVALHATCCESVCVSCCSSVF